VTPSFSATVSDLAFILSSRRGPLVILMEMCSFGREPAHLGYNGVGIVPLPTVRSSLRLSLVNYFSHSRRGPFNLPFMTPLYLLLECPLNMDQFPPRYYVPPPVRITLPTALKSYFGDPLWTHGRRPALLYIPLPLIPATVQFYHQPDLHSRSLICVVLYLLHTSELRSPCLDAGFH